MSLDAGGILHGLAEGFHIEVHDLLRGALGQHQRTGGTVPFLVVAQLAQGGHVGVFGQTGGVEHAQDAQFGLVTAAQGGHVGHLGAGEVHFALAQGQQLVGGTAVGDGLVIEAGGSGQQLGGGMVGSFHTVGGAAQVALGLTGIHQFLEALPGAVGTHDHHAGLAQLVADGHHVADGEGGAGLHG